MARLTFATNILSKHANGEDVHLLAVKRLGSDSNTDDVVLSINASTVGSRSALKKIVEALLVSVMGSKDLTP